jgi:hypothetical protein
VTRDAVVVVPGIMGSELRNERNEVVWGMKPRVLFRQLLSRDVLTRLHLAPGAPDDGIRATALLAFPGYLPLLDGVEPYTDLVAALRKATVHPDAVLPFPYDWRRSIAHNARILEGVATAHLAAWRERIRSLPGHDPSLPDPQLSLVCHSMGGLIARYFTEVLGHREITRRVITLGTPFAGSVKAVRILAHGDILPMGLLAGAVRDAARTFPGVYDLLPRYPCVRAAGLEPLSGAAAAGLGADPDLFAGAAEVHRAVIDAAKAAGAGVCPIRPVVGVTQPTLASLRIDSGEAVFDERLDSEDRRGGDSTVGRDHAFPSLSTPHYLPQRHGKLAGTDEAVAFVVAVLTEREPGAYQGDGIGLRLPDAARATVPFDVEVENLGAGQARCRLIDADSGRQVDVKTPRRSDGRAVATFVAPEPGLYRVTASGGGFNPVEDLLLVLE